MWSQSHTTVILALKQSNSSEFFCLIIFEKHSNCILKLKIIYWAKNPIVFFSESEITDNPDELPLEYDVERIQAYWSKRPGEVIKRTAKILSILIPYFHKLVIWEYLIRRKIRDSPGLQKKYAIELRQILTELGNYHEKLLFLYIRSPFYNFYRLPKN